MRGGRSVQQEPAPWLATGCTNQILFIIRGGSHGAHCLWADELIQSLELKTIQQLKIFWLPWGLALWLRWFHVFLASPRILKINSWQMNSMSGSLSTLLEGNSSLSLCPFRCRVGSADHPPVPSWARTSAIVYFMDSEISFPKGGLIWADS